MSEIIKFSLKKKAIEIPIEQEDGSVVMYEIRRASGDEIESYLDENGSRIKTAVDADGKVKIEHINTYKGMFVSLLKHCLYQNDQKVPASTISKFPHDVQKGLFEEAQTVNGLNDAGAEKAKN